MSKNILLLLIVISNYNNVDLLINHIMMFLYIYILSYFIYNIIDIHKNIIYILKHIKNNTYKFIVLCTVN